MTKLPLPEEPWHEIHVCPSSGTPAAPDLMGGLEEKPKQVVVITNRVKIQGVARFISISPDFDVDHEYSKFNQARIGAILAEPLRHVNKGELMNLI